MPTNESTWEQFSSTMRELIEEASKGWTQAMADTAVGLEKLASHGWYLPISVGWDVPVELGRDDEIDWGQIDPEMCALWTEDLTSTQRELEEDHPRRTPILRQAFAAHEGEQYFISVPAFLSQAEGICVDLVGVQLFQKVAGGRATKVSEVVTATDRMSIAFLAPLVTVQPITWGRANRRSEPGHLNRHAVLHGEDVLYGTKVNSLKALSLLSYASWALHMAKSLEPPGDKE